MKLKELLISYLELIAYSGVRYLRTIGRIILVSSLGIGNVPLCSV